MKSDLIIKGVKRCLSPRLSDCNGCPYRCLPRQECRNALMGNVISLFNRMEQQAHALEREAHLKWEKEVIRDGVLINEDECIKALEKRLNELCIGCDHEDEEWHKSVCPTCIFYHAKVAVSVINNREEEIEELKRQIENLEREAELKWEREVLQDDR